MRTLASKAVVWLRMPSQKAAEDVCYKDNRRALVSGEVFNADVLRNRFQPQTGGFHVFGYISSWMLRFCSG